MYGYTHARACIQAHKCMHARACQTHHSPARFFERRGVRSRSNKTSSALCTRRISDTSCCALAPSYTSKSSRGVVKTASVYCHRAAAHSTRQCAAYGYPRSLASAMQKNNTCTHANHTSSSAACFSTIRPYLVWSKSSVPLRPGAWAGACISKRAGVCACGAILVIITIMLQLVMAY